VGLILVGWYIYRHVRRNRAHAGAEEV
jgi:hypothetical protein